MTASPPRNDETELPFDQYQRYRLVADVIEAVRKPGQKLVVLDVGGRTALLRRFLPHDRVELVDVEASEERGLVLGDGSRLPFQERSFDAVVTFDTLEHVPPNRRDDFVRECRRVARRWVVIAGPYRTPETERAEKLLREFLTTKLRERHRYLEEHHENGLPERAPVEQLLEQLGGRVVSIGHGNLERWLPLMGLSLYLDRDAPLRPIAREFFRYYNRVLFASDHEEPVYRHAVVAAFEDAPLPDAAAVLAQGSPPVGAAGPIEHLARELLSFDVQRDVVEAERSRLEDEHTKLAADLRGHRETVASLRAELEKLQEGERVLGAELAREKTEGGAERAVLAADLEAHKSTLAELQATYDAVQAEVAHVRHLLANEQQQGAEVRDALQKDLSAHRTALAEVLGHATSVEKELEALKELLERERCAASEAIDALRADLAGHSAALADARAERHALSTAFEAERRAFGETEAALRAELAAHQEVQAALGAELDTHRTVQAELIHELERMNGVASSLNEDLVAAHRALEAERAVTAHLRAELRDRWKNLKRALRWRKPPL